MALSDLILVNRALSLIGERPLSNLSGTDVVTVEATRHYEAAVDEVLSSYRWRCSRMRSRLTEMAGGADRTKWNYRHFLPTGDTSNYGRARQEVSSVVCTGDTAGSLAGKYFTIGTPRAEYYVWFKVSNVGSDPAPTDADGNAMNGIEVDISTGAANTTVAAAVETAMEATGIWSVVVTTATCAITNTEYGAATNADDGTSGFTVSTSTAGLDGKLYQVIGVVDVENGSGSWEEDNFEAYEIEAGTILSNREDLEIVYNGRANEATFDQNVASLVELLLAGKLTTKIAGGRQKKMDFIGLYERRWQQMTQADGKSARNRKRPAKNWADYRYGRRPYNDRPRVLDG